MLNLPIIYTIRYKYFFEKNLIIINQGIHYLLFML